MVEAQVVAYRLELIWRLTPCDSCDSCDTSSELAGNCRKCRRPLSTKFEPFGTSRDAKNGT